MQNMSREQKKRSLRKDSVKGESISFIVGNSPGPESTVRPDTDSVALGDNFTNTLLAAFSYENFTRSFFCLHFRFELFWRKNIGTNELIKCGWNWPWTFKLSRPLLLIFGLIYGLVVFEVTVDLYFRYSYSPYKSSPSRTWPFSPTRTNVWTKLEII